MKNWQKLLFLKAVVLCFIFFLLGCGSNDVKKAQEFMTAGMYPQAIELLNKRIGEKPSDPDAHFLMGICNIHTNNDRAANDRFASAVRLKPDYGFKIGDEYRKAGTEAITNGDISRALNLYLQAVNYQLGLKDEIGTELLAEGKSFFEKERHKMAAARFTAANRIKPELGATIAEYYYQAGKKPDVPMELKTLCFDNAVKYVKKSKYAQAHADHHYELSKLIKTTEEAISELRIANQFGKLYSSELKAKQEQLELETFQTTISQFIKKRGKPDFDKTLTVKGKKHIIFKDPKLNYKFHYLSSGEFTGGDNDSEFKCITSPNSCRRIGYFTRSEINGPFYITKRKNNVRVVGWINK